MKGFVNSWLFKRDKEKLIENEIKKEGNIIYGARSIMKQVPTFVRRETEDYDVYSKRPLRSAKRLERKLDKQAKCDYYYVKPAQHKGTYKVMDRGKNLKDKSDNRGVADFTLMPKPKPKTIKIKGTNYTRLNVERKAKRSALKDKTQKFRHEKDRDDLRRIKQKRLFR